jgi:hypothetical protein
MAIVVVKLAFISEECEMKADNDFCALMLSSSCFGKEACPSLPCACAQSLVDRCVAQFMERLQDHYWDSLAPHKDLILKHVRGALGQ